MTALIIVVAIFAGGAVVTVIGAFLIDRAHRPRGRFIDVGGFRQHVVEIGSGTAGAPPVVLLHGAGANLEDMYLALGKRLAARHRVILVDRPGLGHSARSKRSGCSPVEQAGVLRAVLERLGVEQPIVVGHSWGGTLALAYALDFPQAVAGLVLAAPATHPGVWPLSRLNAILNGPIGWLFVRTLALPFGVALIWPGSRTAFLPQRIPEHYVRDSAAMLVLRPPTLMNNWADVGCLEAVLTQQAARYGSLATPTIAFSGDRGLLAPPAAHTLKLAAAAACVKVHVLPGYGHMLHYDAADRIAAAVEELSAPHSFTSAS
jgi:pimeloyl-ACP methyl ester carboxylesterase